MLKKVWNSEFFALGTRGSSLKANALKLDEKGKRIIPFEIYRFRGNGTPYTETFEVDTKDTPMVLDALIKIKNTIDPTLTFRRSCREGICGSCSMNIAGTNTLACLCTLEEALTPDGQIRIYPLPHHPVVKDLVPDMTKFYQHHKSVEPWLHLTPEQEQQKTEILQSPEDRALLDGLYECILCACCSASCPSYWWHGADDYLGPAILLQAFRWLADSRDVATRYRLQQLGSNLGKAFQCHQILNCTLACPKSLNPARAAGYVKEMIVAQQSSEGISNVDGIAPTMVTLFENPHEKHVSEIKEEKGLMARE